MDCIDSRRLTGPNLHLPVPGVVAEVACADDTEASAFVENWKTLIRPALDSVGFEGETVFHRIQNGHASVGFSGPIDRLYAGTELNEWAVSSAISGDKSRFSEVEPAILAAVAEEQNPRLLALERTAKERGLPFLWDDDFVSIGYGETAQTWPADKLPDLDAVHWFPMRKIPIALVTGTNGKTTTSRMLTRILVTAGYTAGSTSSDGICIQEEFVESGDWTGPGAARTVMRHPRVNAAVLEAARGGLLRRGVGVNACDVAIVTNVSADHLGEYGVHTVREMAEVKALVTTVVAPNGLRVLNADDENTVAIGRTGDTSIAWFSTKGDTPHILNHCASGGQACILKDDMLMYYNGTQRTPLAHINTLPSALSGAATHNIANALAASAAAIHLGVSVQIIQTALQSFGSKHEDNPGRCQQFSIEAFHLIVDFAHNPAGVSAVLSLARSMMKQGDYQRLCVSIGQAGDRSNDALDALAEAVFAADPEYVLLRKIAGYERGRGTDEVPKRLQSHLVQQGFDHSKTAICIDEVDSLSKAEEWANGKDLVVHLIHIQRKPVQAWLKERNAYE